MSDHLLPIRRKVLEILTQSNGSENIFTLLRKVEEDVEWVNLGYLSEAIQDADSLVRRGNSVFLTQEIQPEAPVRVEQVAQPLFPGEWQFIDNDDLSEFERWLEVRFERHLSRPGAQEKEMARTLLSKVHEMCTIPAADLDVETVEALWSELDDYDAEYKFAGGLVWGLWRIGRERMSDTYMIGNTECQLIYPANGTTTIHEYSRRPGKLRWKVLPVEQEGATFYIGVAPVKEVDAVSAVPDLPESMTCQKAASRVLDEELGKNEWQRQLSVKRRESIMQFMEQSESILANAPLLFVYDDERVEFGSSAVEIDLGWLQKQRIERDGRRYETYRDVIQEGRDNRPLWLIDGQHRIRGGAGSKRGREVMVPIVIFPHDFQLDNTAKIFAEINTLQEGLDEFHSLFMQHRFHIPSPNVKRDFRVNEDRVPETPDSQANHWSYELAACLCTDTQSPLRGRVRFLKQNDQRSPVVKATQWLDFSRSWVKSLYVEDAMGATFDDLLLEVGNYFKAFASMYARNPRPAWAYGKDNKSLIQQQTHFVVLLMVYPRVREFAFRFRTGGEGTLTEPEFRSAMAAWKNINWWDSDLTARFGGGGEKPRRSLLAWMQDALGAEPASTADIHNDVESSLAGRSLFAAPARCELTKRHGNNWMIHPGDYMVFKAERPLNALPTMRWELETMTGDEVSSGQVICRDGNSAEWRVAHTDVWNATNEFKLVVKWDNINGPSTTTLLLQRYS